MNQKDQERIKELGKILPKRMKHKSGKFSVIVSDQMREDFGKLYLEEEKKAKKNE